MIVIDAAAFAEVLSHTAPGDRVGRVLAENGEEVHAPSIIDAETASALRGLVLGGDMSETAAQAGLEDMRDFELHRHRYQPLLPQAWELRENCTIYDALYVVLADALEAPLLTTDGKLANAVHQVTGVEAIVPT